MSYSTILKYEGVKARPSPLQPYKTRRFSWRLAVVTAFVAVASPLWAQPPRPTPVPTLKAAPALLPALQLDPQVLGADGNVVVSLPPNFPLSTNRFRVALFEANRPARVADVRREFRLVNGRQQTSLRIEADPGAYDVRLVSDNKERTPITAAAPLLVPGIERDPGWWLVNGTPFLKAVENIDNAGTTSPNSLFLAGLQRDLERGQKSYPPIRVPNGTDLPWRVLRLPNLGESLDRIDIAAFRNQLTASLKEQQNSGARNLFGIVLSAPELAKTASQSATSMRQLRQAVREAAPGAAFFLEFETGDRAVSEAAARQIGALASFADAVVIRADSAAASTWPIKAARRVAEEQPNFDLPIFLQLPDGAASLSPMQLLDFWMGGVSGIVSDGAIDSVASTKRTPTDDWTPLILRNLPLFAGAVTLEDSGLLPAPDQKGGATTVAQYEYLRSLGRIPLLARLAIKDSRGESLMVRLDQDVSDETLASLLNTARAGARIYIEGAPLEDEKGAAVPAARWTSLTEATVRTIEPRDDSLVLEDPWTFGTAQGTRLKVQRNIEAKLGGTTATQARKPEKGRDVLTDPRVLAHFEDGSPALIVNPIGRGEVIWMPNPPAQVTTGRTRVGAPANDVNSLRQFYNAIAAYVQPALVELAPASGTSGSAADTSGIRVALRRSLKGTLILAVMNTGNTTGPKAIEVSLLSPAIVALDLATETELPLEKRGLQTRFSVTIPAQGWKLIAFGETREKLDDERNAPRLKAKVR